MRLYLLCVLVMTVFFTNCSTNKKSKTKSSSNVQIDDPAINLDTIKIVANPEPKKKVYRATNTLTNDILHTRLFVNFDWTNSQLIGKAELKLSPYFYPVSMLYLNARGMEIKKVQLFETFFELKTNVVKGKKTESASEAMKELPVTYKYENDSLKINLGRLFTSQEIYYVNIEYIAKPNDLKSGGSDAINSDKGLYFINPKGEDPDKMPQIWTQGETQSNSAWFPTVDTPNEKMTNEIFMTVDNKYTTLSNGLLIASVKNTDGTRTDHWKMDLPHSSYLVMMAVGEFIKVTDAPWKGKEVSYYVEKEYEPHAKAIFGNTKEMINFYSEKLGVDFPWQKYAQIVVRDFVSGAMENTSATLHGDFMVYQTTRELIDGSKGEDVIAHELFHQWFGDLVTAESWSNLPLNESFATYGEYLWEEHKYGRDAADEHHAASRYGYLAQSMQKQVHLIRFDYDDKEDMFDGFSYNKGGQVLHMLRKYVGDEAFFTSLKLYLETRKFKNAEIHDLRLAFEEITKEDLNWFFNQWFMAKGHPSIEVTKNYNETDKTLSLSVKQKHDLSEYPLYQLPVYVDIYNAGKKVRQRIWIKDTEQTFTFSVASNPDLVNFDADRQMLADIKYSKTTSEYIYQYQNAGLWGDRSEALKYFKNHKNEKQVYEILKWIAKNDKWKGLRSEAITVLSEIAGQNENELKPLFYDIALTDINTNVRASAIAALSDNFKGADLDELYAKSLNEQSYAILSEAFSALVKNNPEAAMTKAKELENETGKKIVFAIADLYSKNGDDRQHDYFVKIKKLFSGFELMSFNNIYGKFLKRCNKPETAYAAAAELSDMAKSGNQFVKYTSLRVFKSSLVDGWQERERKLTDLIEKAKKENQSTSQLEAELKMVSGTSKKLIELYKAAEK